MNKEETNALQLLTGKNLLDEVSVEELQQLASDYPYFSIAQLFLFKKLQHDHHPEVQQQLYKTTLYFPNEPWMHYLLLSTSKEAANSATALQNASEKSTEITEPVTGYFSNREADNTDITEEQELVTELPPDDVQEEPVLLNDELQADEDNNIITLPIESPPEEFAADDIHAEPEEMPLDEDELAQQTQPLPVEESNQKIARLLSEQVQDFHKPVEPEQPVLIETEPYHTVDYFASQGIKLDNKKEDNNFDKKVHKFTDWLRQMKRIHPQPADLGTNEEEETQIAHIAASSNQIKEIVTESMAEVLLKQNKQDKAIEIYEKLSLLYPSKNAYFAAKIQQLKQ